MVISRDQRVISHDLQMITRHCCSRAVEINVLGYLSLVANFETAHLVQHSHPQPPPPTRQEN